MNKIFLINYFRLQPYIVEELCYTRLLYCARFQPSLLKIGLHTCLDYCARFQPWFDKIYIHGFTLALMQIVPCIVKDSLTHLWIFFLDYDARFNLHLTRFTFMDLHLH